MDKLAKKKLRRARRRREFGGSDGVMSDLTDSDEFDFAEAEKEFKTTLKKSKKKSSPAKEKLPPKVQKPPVTP